MYLWRRRASRKWLNNNEEALRIVAADALAIIERPNRKQVQCEVASNQRTQLEKIAKQFGGRIRKLPSEWLKRFSRNRQTKPLRIGTRLLVVSSKSGALQCAVYNKSADRRPPLLVIPAGAAFGTGEHVTTAMSLRMLEQLFRFRGAQAAGLWRSATRRTQTTPASRRNSQAGRLRSPDVLDLGTGSGILALAAKLLGAKKVVAIDNDPIAIRIAKQNAKLNRIRGVQFQVADVRRWKMPSNIDVVSANLFSELLVDVIPKLKGAQWLILSGILRSQERDVRRALTRNAIRVVEVRRRGKWVAMLAGHR